MADVSTPIDLQSGRTVDGKFLRVVLASWKLTSRLLIQSSFDAFLKINEVKLLVYVSERVLTFWQETSEITGKIDSVLARLDRLGAVVNGACDDNEFQRRLILFE